MAIPVALLKMFGAAVGEKLLSGLLARKDGGKKLERAGAAMTQGLTAIEALKKTFGKEFLTVLNNSLGASGGTKFTYEAGTQAYIRIGKPSKPSIKALRDELNINLDRISVLEGVASSRKNLFLGLLSTWQSRVRKSYEATDKDDIDSTFAAMENILKGESRNYKQIYQILSATSLGGVGALMIIEGVLSATGTGVGLVAAISLFLFGIPWMTVGALLLPGALLLLLAAKLTRPSEAISLSIALAYKLLKRIESTKQSQASLL